MLDTSWVMILIAAVALSPLNPLGWLATFRSTSAMPVVKTAAQQAKNPIVVMETSKGAIKIELFQDKAPITVKNFLQYADDKHYDNTLFHRVIKNFMIQGGGQDLEKRLKPTKTAIKNESDNGLSNVRGTIAMARGKGADSATCQFYINVVDNQKLDRANAKDKAGYCVFGRVVEGMDVADVIRAVATDPNNDSPLDLVVIKSVRRLETK